MTRNVGITLTDLAYQVWIKIPHGLRSNLISQFLIKNAEALTNLESPYDKLLHINKGKASSMIEDLLAIEPEDSSESPDGKHHKTIR